MALTVFVADIRLDFAEVIFLCYQLRQNTLEHWYLLTKHLQMISTTVQINIFPSNSDENIIKMFTGYIEYQPT